MNHLCHSTFSRNNFDGMPPIRHRSNFTDFVTKEFCATTVEGAMDTFLQIVTFEPIHE